MAKKTFPDVLYVKHETDGSESWFTPSADAGDHAEIGEKVQIAVYRMDRIATVTAQPEVK